ncbi:hypothetical protein BVC71_13420 [Marivivens niveibacter]|uniref:Uncharacterized protein n=1 Tax=Marivivens niveibacter TaxID=1930667 RepID=A0A251WWP8_9RHOB|nr:hypothetical protein BVC71_13420 [Marivivens niveibacter]
MIWSWSASDGNIPVVIWRPPDSGWTYLLVKIPLIGGVDVLWFEAANLMAFTAIKKTDCRREANEFGLLPVAAIDYSQPLRIAVSTCRVIART